VNKKFLFLLLFFSFLMACLASALPVTYNGFLNGYEGLVNVSVVDSVDGSLLEQGFFQEDFVINVECYENKEIEFYVNGVLKNSFFQPSQASVVSLDFFNDSASEESSESGSVDGSSDSSSSSTSSYSSSSGSNITSQPSPVVGGVSKNFSEGELSSENSENIDSSVEEEDDFVVEESPLDDGEGEKLSVDDEDGFFDWQWWFLFACLFLSALRAVLFYYRFDDF